MKFSYIPKAYAFAALLLSSLTMAAAPIDGFYSSVFGGFTWLFGDLNVVRSQQIWDVAEHRWGYNAGLRLGYQSNPLRYEGEFTYINNELHSFHVAGLPQTYPHGSTDAGIVMANVYYDFPDMVPAVSPFLGLGIGYAFVNSRFHGRGPFIRTDFVTNTSAFAYQGTAGLTFNFTPNYALNIAYRFTATTSLKNLGLPYQANLATAGVIYRFDGDNYK